MEREPCRRKIPIREVERLQREGHAVYRCEKRGSKLFFWCPYCLTEHAHSAEDTRPFEPASRSRHCTSQTGQEQHKWGYFIFYTEK